MVRACEQALAVGVPAVAFTEHVEAERWQSTDGKAQRNLARKVSRWVRPLDVQGYFASLAECRERFPALRILSGIETGEPHLNQATVAAVMGQGSFDRVLASLHVVPIGGRLLSVGGALGIHGGAGAPDAMRRYLGELVELIEGSDGFEILAHIDFPRRYWPRSAPAYVEADYEEEFRGVLRALAETERVLEINTRTALASLDLLRWWREEGGRAVSFGSDAHTPWRVGEHFERAMDVAEASGFYPGADAFDFWRR